MTVHALVLKASAKINLDLRIVGRRADGFHELRTVFQSLALHDVLAFRRVRSGFRLEGTAPGVPLDRSNLIWQAAEAAWQAAGRSGPVRGIAVTVEKEIPHAAGLGGGSSNAAATLLAVNRVLCLGLGPRQLHDAASTLGSDVPFFLVGGTALGLGRGEELYQLPDLPPHQVVLVRPAFGVSTAEAYHWFTELEDSPSGGRTALRAVSAAWRQTMRPGQSPPQRQTLPVSWRPGGLELVNDLERAVLPRSPDLGEIRDALLERGAIGALMAGSGSTVFGLFTDVAAACAAAAAVRRPGWTVIRTRTLGRRSFARRMAGRAAP